MRPSPLLLSLIATLAYTHPTQRPSSSDWPSLSALLARVDNDLLHSILHELSPKYQHGVFHEDKSAVEQVHSSDHALATKLVHMALKRQDNGTVTTTTSSSTSDTITTRDESATTEEEPATTTTTTTATTPTPPSTTTSVPPPDTTTVAPPPDTTTPAPPPETPIETTTTEVVAPTPEPEPTVPTEAPPAPTTAGGDDGVVTVGGGVATETSQTVVVDITTEPSTQVYTSTGANGEVQTLTSVVLVTAPVTTSAPGTAGAAATEGPGLQDAATGAARPDILAVCIAMAAAVGVGAMAVVL